MEGPISEKRAGDCFKGIRYVLSKQTPRNDMEWGEKDNDFDVVVDVLRPNKS